MGATASQRDGRTWQARCEQHERVWFGPPRGEESVATDDAILHVHLRHV